MTPQEELEYLELLELEAKAGGGPVPAAAAATPAPASDVDKMKAAIMTANKNIGVGESTEAALRALDYSGGIMRTGVYAVPRAAKAIYDQDPAQADSMQEDLLNALKGKAPSSSELMDRLGIDKGASYNVPVLGDVSVRGALGLGSDIALGGIASNAAAQAAQKSGVLGAIGKLFSLPDKAIQSATEKTARKIYKGGFGSIDEELAAKGAAPLSDMLFDEGFIGTSKAAQKKVKSLLNKNAAQRERLYSQYTRPVTPDLADLEQQLAKMAENPGLKQKAAELQNYIDQYKFQSPGGLPVAQASEFKTAFRDALPDSAFKLTEFGGKKITNAAQKVERGLGNAYKDAIIEAGEASTPGLGIAVDQANKRFQTLLTAQGPLQREAMKAARTKGVTVLDATLAAAAATNPALFLSMLAAKKGVQAANTTAGRTLLGQTLNAAKQPISVLLRQNLSRLGDANGNEQ